MCYIDFILVDVNYMIKRITLPSSVNTNSAIAIHKIIKTHNGESRFVGGCIREALRNKKTTDIDIATTLKPEKIIEILEQENYKVIPTGIKYGTVTAICNGEIFEITTLRQGSKMLWS